jgi:hypothetical protein
MDGIQNENPVSRSASTKSIDKPSRHMAEITEQGPISAGDQMQSAEDVAMGRRINRKLDMALLPFLSLLYLFNGLDRSNIGNAETQGRCWH